MAHRHHADPAHRRFVVDSVRTRGFLDTSPHYEKQASGLLAARAAEETDGRILAKVLEAFSAHDHPDQEAIGLRHVGHPDPRVRRDVPTPSARAPRPARPQSGPPSAPSCVHREHAGYDLLPDITSVLLTLAQAPDAEQRAFAAAVLAQSRRPRLR